jgi:hypothetical protein
MEQDVREEVPPGELPAELVGAAVRRAALELERRERAEVQMWREPRGRAAAEQVSRVAVSNRSAPVRNRRASERAARSPPLAASASDGS